MNASDAEGSGIDGDVVRVQVDGNICIASGLCEMLEEQTFSVDDDTVIANVIGSGRLPRPRAQAVVDACPSTAISIAAE